MKWKPSSLIPVLICAGVTGATCFLEWLADRDLFSPGQRVEWITYDWRVRLAAQSSPVVATNLGVITITDESIETVLAGDGTLPYRFGLQWPRQVYARLVNELHAQGAKGIGFDIVFAELRPDHLPTLVEGEPIGSDEFFARELRRAGAAILAAKDTVTPAELFRTNAWATADISAEREVDGILRRARAYSVATVWHPIIRQAARAFGWKLAEARIEKGRILFPREDRQSNVFDPLPLNAAQDFDAAFLESQLNERPDKTPKPPRWERPSNRERFWQLGILLAARGLDLDLSRARIDLDQGRIEIPDAHGAIHVIPVDREGRFHIDWSITAQDPRLTKEGIEYLLGQYESRLAGRMDEVTNRWADKLVVVGSLATGNDLTDMGATPLEHDTFLMSEHWNVANSLLTNRFIRPLPPWQKLALIWGFGLLAWVITMNLRSIVAIFTVGLVFCGYVAFACYAFVEWRLWLPMVMPMGGSLIVTHVILITYLVRFEQRERQHTKDIFSRIVSPEVVGELLGREKLSLEGARRELTIFFADVRGFTEITDAHQQRAETYAHTHHLHGADAARRYDAEAEVVLNTVNLYLGIAADCVKVHGGTLDKYIGDCVMAFWGAPLPDDQHAVRCVRAVLDMQRAIARLNLERRAENSRREEENLHRQLQGEEPQSLLEILSLGSGVNTGFVTVGLMGSEKHLMNYTIFGREVNLASRLETASGRGRILIGEHTYRALLRDDPALAATCVAQPPLTLKGFREPVQAYEVPWHTAELSLDEAGQSMTIIRTKGGGGSSY